MGAGLAQQGPGLISHPVFMCTSNAFHLLFPPPDPCIQGKYLEKSVSGSQAYMLSTEHGGVSLYSQDVEGRNKGIRSSRPA